MTSWLIQNVILYGMIRSSLICFALILSLSACAPAAVCIDDTAFAATVTAVASETFRVQPERGGPLTVAAGAQTRIVSASGDTLPLANLTLGTQVYVRGSLTGEEVTAQEVRVLDR